MLVSTFNANSGKKIILLGGRGENGNNDYVSTVEYYDPKTGIRMQKDTNIRFVSTFNTCSQFTHRKIVALGTNKENDLQMVSYKINDRKLNIIAYIDDL